MAEAPSAAWDVYARTAPTRRAVNSRGEKTWFNWTQHADHGPGAEVLGLGAGGKAVDLGCGSGGNAAHLARLGMRAVGVDLSARQLARARERWGETGGVEWVERDALDWLTAGPGGWDAVYSVFGAAWFTDPELLAPTVYAGLRDGGVFAFSHRPPVEGCYGRQAAFIPRGEGEDPAVVTRWDHPPETWCELLQGCGYKDVTATVIPPPEQGPRRAGTLLVRGVRGAGSRAG
ncbi:methyltransferase domain-containing protein [Streptomyces sp. SID5473]|uniref:Class I SAM-dependent methyltransferase n=1 Tax=Streptomyces tsukubensis (strain DSM 42081 / NBRC 108919 / NRRL 18488 / 9993) TaxID=1114943 RepID=A0A7G3UFI1_STRT9|nr:SAM-dependent methyltransferase [Streptomyces tsukubensis]MYS68813.1 methyltransferase domain-containing protein [Streptomyces sp. SID5473]QKM68311.1 class I SAM-dependent methyltransferase [Streptomyces tsukubensis NRRL18488]TAI43128.1 class I SAM-dependent methyltransferase [Streptomyces tsukubensis]